MRVGCRAGHLRQEETPWAPEPPVLRAFTQGREGFLEDHAENLLSLGRFSTPDLRRRLKDGSYGRRRRAGIAQLVSDPMVLLLDDPINHLTPALAEELEQALADESAPSGQSLTTGGCGPVSPAPA